MALKDDLKAMIAGATSEREAKLAQAKEAAEQSKADEARKAVEAVLHLLSDETIKTIIDAHLAKGGTRQATLAIKGSTISLVKTVRAGGVSPGFQLPITFAAQGIVAEQSFNETDVSARVRELASEGVVVTHKYHVGANSLVVTIDYGSLLEAVQ